jgi:hypothetical protein
MSFIIDLFPELRLEIVGLLDMRARHALARTCRVLLAEDGGAATRLPVAWMEQLREERDALNLYIPRRDMFWELHALGVAHWPCDVPWHFSSYTIHSERQFVTMRFPGIPHPHQVSFVATWLLDPFRHSGTVLAGRLHIFLGMRLPVPETLSFADTTYFEWILTDPLDFGHRWLLDIARHVACAKTE